MAKRVGKPGISKWSGRIYSPLCVGTVVCAYRAALTGNELLFDDAVERMRCVQRRARVDLDQPWAQLHVQKDLHAARAATRWN